MDSRERVLAALHHRQPDRVPYTDSPWLSALERWRAEGMPADADPAEFFGYEFVGFGADTSMRLPRVILEETDDFIIERNANGATTKNWKHATATPHLLDFLITTPEAWEEHKPRLAWAPERLLWATDRPLYEKARREGKFVHISFAIGYDELSSIAGPETLLPAMLTDPDWVADMFHTFMDLKLAATEEMLAAGYEFDGAFVYDDLGYRNGPFFSTDVYRALLQPEHKRLCDLFHSKGWKVILHSCGNVNIHIPALLEAGFDCLQPLEVKAGMDLLQLKRDYAGRLALMGGLDVRVLAHPDPAAAEREIREKLTVARAGGGYIAHSDHSVPDNISLERYLQVIAWIHKYGTY